MAPKMDKMNVERKFRLPRIWSNQELKKFAHLFSGKIINVSAGENVDKQGSTYDKYFINATEFWLSNYAPGSFRGFEGKPNELLIDLEQELPEVLIEKFDVVFNHTTLEHIFDFKMAFRNMCALTSDIVILVVPFAQEQHENEGYYDYWRFTPRAIRELFRLNQLEVIYESANNDFNAGTYIFHIGSKKPERWSSLFPERGELLNNVANWIGSK
jgi:hypothetical protein